MVGVFIPICVNGAKRYRKNEVITKDNRGIVKDKVMIVERPEIVAKRTSWGCRS